MPDYNEIKNYINYNVINNNKIYYPSTYDDYRKIILPYQFQNINFKKLKENYEIGLRNLKTAVFSNGEKQNSLTWIKVTNDEELDKNKLYKSTFHYDVISKYGELIKEYFGAGSNVDLLTEERFARKEEGEAPIKCSLLWNYAYGKLFLIWYILVDKEGEPLTDENDNTKTPEDIALEYLEQLSGKGVDQTEYRKFVFNSGSPYLQKDFNDYDNSEGLGIILRAISELGLEYEDLKSYYIRYIYQGGNLEYPTTRRLEMLEQFVENENENSDDTWAGELQNCRKYYFDSIDRLKGSLKENEHIIINENKAIFYPTKYTTFTFNITNSNFTDYGIPLDSNIHFWEANKEYNVGDLVIGITPRKNENETKLLDECGFGYIYKCVRKHSGEYFKKVEKKKTKEEINQSTGNKIITYQTVKNWLLIDTNFIKEIRAFNRVYRLSDETLKDYIDLQGYDYEDIKNGTWREQVGNTKEEDKLVLVRFMLPPITREKKLVAEQGELIDKQIGKIIWETNLPDDVITLNETGIVDDSVSSGAPYSIYLREIIDTENGRSHFYNLTKDIFDIPEPTSESINQNQTEVDTEKAIDSAAITDTQEITPINERGTPCVLNRNIININTRAIRYFLVPLKYLHNGFFVSVKFDSFLSRIEKNVFENRTDLVKVVFNSYTYRINDKAFSNCKNLKEVILPKGLSFLGEKAFASCLSLTQVTLPDKVKELKGTYIGCTNLKSVVLNKCKKIGDYTFMNCINLENVYGTENIESLGIDAFSNCEKMRRFNINKNLTEIPNRAFKNCKNCSFKYLSRLDEEEINKLDDIKFIGEYAFENCYKINKAFPIEADCILSKGVYKNCKNLVSATLPEVIEDHIVPEELFYGCFNLKQLNNFENNDTIRVLSNKCFQNCGFLESITLPFENVDSLAETATPQYEIGENVFWNCFNLREVRVKDDSVIELIKNSINKNNWIDATFTKIKKIEEVNNNE